MQKANSLIESITQALTHFSQCITPPYRTPLEYNSRLSGELGLEVLMKFEHMQYTGSFKYRGALNRILSLSAREREQGVVTASSGNHGMACAYAAGETRVPMTVFVPASASALKVDKIQSFGATVVKVEGDCLQAELQARAEAEKSGKTYISPYNDELVMAGQGTIGQELLSDGQKLDAVFIAVGGGGLAGGVGAWIKAHSPQTRIIGCWPENAPAMGRCLEAGRIHEVDESATLSDGTAGGVETGAVTFEVCQEVIDQHVYVKEDAIARHIQEFARHERMIIEGAAAVAVAGLVECASEFKGKRVAAILCGRNIAYDTLMSVLNAAPSSAS